MKEMIDYYNKFCEEKRLDSRHGQVEYRITMEYIHKMLRLLEQEQGTKELKILDIGAGTGRYSVPLSEEGYDVTAIELVNYNLGILRSKNSKVKAYQGDACKLSRLKDHEYDLTLLFGPMYHLFSKEDKEQALREAKRVTRGNGIIMIAYVMNEYGLLTYGFKERHILECKAENRLTGEYQCLSNPEHLYDYVRLEQMDALKDSVGLQRITVLSPDGPANYMRPFLRQLSEEEFEEFICYQRKVCERRDLIGAGAHTVDILRCPQEQKESIS